MQQIVARLKERLGERQLTVQIAELPDCHGDRALLEQVLVNLLSNAFKFTAGRDAARVEIGVLRQGETAVYYVRDNGVGFDMHATPISFSFGVSSSACIRRRPSRAPASACPSCIGSLRAMAARGVGDSRPGEGAIFYFSLPEPGGTVRGRREFR